MSTTLRALRQAQGLSAAELARRSGVNERTIRNLEQGVHTHPTVVTLHKLAAALDVPPADLLADPST